MNTTEIVTPNIVTAGIITAGIVTEPAAPPNTSPAASPRAAGPTTATGAPVASAGASPAIPPPAGSAAARPGGTAAGTRAVTDRAAARTVAGARPPGRRDQRGPGGVRPRSRPYTAPHELFAERLLAVLSGSRPVHWMLGQTVGEAYEQLVLLAPATPLRGRSARPVVRRCRGFQPRPGVIEAFASVAAGEQVRALAFRLEQGADLRWRCAAVETGGERGAPTA